MNAAPRLLLITNDYREGLALGPVEGFKKLADDGQLAEVSSISYAAAVSPREAHGKIARAIRSFKPDVILAWTGINFPTTERERDEMESLVSSRTVLFWEGDPWGGRKVHGVAARWWLGHADLVFSVAGEPQLSLLLSYGARAVQFMPHTFSHIQFARAVMTPPDPPVALPYDVSMIAGNYTKIPGVRGLPGSFDRLRLAMSMRATLGARFRLHGKGWPWLVSDGYVPYDEQVDAIRGSRVSVNWDHFPRHESYASDRLAISLLSGRPHVTGLHPKMDWAPGQSLGLFQEKTAGLVRRRALELLHADPLVLHSQGLEAWNWVRHRMSNIEGARFMVSRVVDSVPPLTMEPWTRLPGPLASQ